MKNTKISTSILAADFTRMGDLIGELEKAKSDLLHIDVMDGLFVPNISFGPKMVEDINKITDIPLDVHLMIQNPAKYIDKFAAAGSDIITIHFEATDDIGRDVEKIRSHNIKAGVSIKPATPVSALKNFLPHIDLVLVMSVEPGFGGQKFMPSALDKINELYKLRAESNLDFIIEVDGGVTNENAAVLIAAGCDMIVSGSFITNAKDKDEAIALLRKA